MPFAPTEHTWLSKEKFSLLHLPPESFLILLKNSYLIPRLILVKVSLTFAKVN